MSRAGEINWRCGIVNSDISAFTELNFHSFFFVTLHWILRNYGAIASRWARDAMRITPWTDVVKEGQLKLVLLLSI